MNKSQCDTSSEHQLNHDKSDCDTNSEHQLNHDNPTVTLIHGISCTMMNKLL